MIPDVYNSQSLNCYSYVLNNPYKYMDEEGHNWAVPIAMLAYSIGTMSYEIHVQRKVTGKIYSPSRVGMAFVKGVGAGLMTVGGLLSPIFWNGGVGQAECMLIVSESNIIKNMKL